jgi:hypothetical protein
LIGVGVQIAATTGAGLAVAAGELDADCVGVVAEADAAGRADAADGEGVDEPQPTRTTKPAHSSPKDWRFLRRVSALIMRTLLSRPWPRFARGVFGC